MNRIAWIGLSLLATSAIGCSDDDPAGTGGTGGSGASSSGTPGSGGSGEGGAATGGSGTTGGAGASGSECTNALEEALGPIDEVSDDDVVPGALVEGAREIYIDATAGGFQAAAMNPAVYVKLGDGTKVAVTDPASLSSTDWDLAFKRYVVRSNSGDGGPGNAAAAFLNNKDFAAATLADAQAAMLEQEIWFDENCDYELDATNGLVTTFSSWFMYEGMVLTPQPGTWVVRGADRTSLYKLELLTYYADPDGGEEPTVGARFRVKVAALQ
ncbi:MAG: HmuY family protein [Polyangiaceae bacterium]